MLGTYHLNALFDILNKLHFVYEPDKLWAFVLEQACKTIQAEGGTFFVIAPDERELFPMACFGIDQTRLRKLTFKMGVGVCGWVAQYQQPALVTDVRQESRFNRAVDHSMGMITKSMLCTPVFSQKKNYGVLEIINRKSGTFGAQDQEFMTLLGRQAAVAYQNLLLLDEVSHTKVLLESLVGNLSGGLVAMDQSERITVLNPAAILLLGLATATYVGKTAADVFQESPWFLQILKQTFTSQKTASRQEITLSLKGEEARLGYTTILISDPHKTVLGSGIIFQKLS